MVVIFYLSLCTISSHILLRVHVQARSALRTAADFLRRLQQEAEEDGEEGGRGSAYALLQARAF